MKVAATLSTGAATSGAMSAYFVAAFAYCDTTVVGALLGDSILSWFLSLVVRSSGGSSRESSPSGLTHQRSRPSTRSSAVGPTHPANGSTPSSLHQPATT